MTRPEQTDSSLAGRRQALSDARSDRRSLRILIVNTLADNEADDIALERDGRARALRIGLLEAGYNIVAVFPADMHLPDRIAQLQPDMVIIDAESDARDVLEHVVMATHEAPRPIVLFTEDQDRSSMEAAMAAGVSAYIVAGLSSERVKPVLDVALARFNADQKLRNELSDTKLKLAERKTIERAKGLLMERHGIAEDEAYGRLRSLAMDKNLKLSELAQRILDAADLLG
ncbi:ANTAR domain-containing response regulator [Oxalicibacterium solurbis]|uniref:ANTAR domain-containing response regulator n=1 Tax=Oxalicibacterium solurbis TaxID=69280 RepID=UPI00166B499F|nr:ANTAR domain-containing protein [Oxalicibacterium solurbis]